MSTPFKMERGVKYRDAAKTSIIPVKNIDPDQELLKKPEWMKIKLPSSSLKIETIKNGMASSWPTFCLRRSVLSKFTRVL